MAVLLKVSAGLSLAAAASDRPTPESRGDLGGAAPSVGKPGEGLPGFTGIWHSRHVHPADPAGTAARVDEHYVAIRQEGRRLTGESVATATAGSSLRVELELSGQIATGTWQLRRAPVEGRPSVVNHGVLQLVVDRRGQRMTGRWAGFDHESRISSDVWEFDRVDEARARQCPIPDQAPPAEPAVPCAQRSNR